MGRRVWPPWKVDLVEKFRGKGEAEGVEDCRLLGARGEAAVPPDVDLAPLLEPPLAVSGRLVTLVFSVEEDLESYV